MRVRPFSNPFNWIPARFPNVRNAHCHGNNPPARQKDQKKTRPPGRLPPKMAFACCLLAGIVLEGRLCCECGSRGGIVGKLKPTPLSARRHMSPLRKPLLREWGIPGISRTTPAAQKVQYAFLTTNSPSETYSFPHVSTTRPGFLRFLLRSNPPNSRKTFSTPVTGSLREAAHAPQTNENAADFLRTQIKGPM